MKIIFLDIDGVLNSEQHMKTEPFRTGSSFMSYEGSQIDPELVKNLNAITDATGANLVISSTWRFKIKEVRMFREFAKYVGIKAPIIGYTNTVPDDTRRSIQAETGNWIDRVFRGHEIHAWLIDNKHLEIDSYVILDDNSDMEYMTPHLVQTQFECGLTVSDAQRAIAHLCKKT